MSGWIKLHRSLIDWEWYTDINTCKLFLHLILKANHKDNTHRGKVVKRGQLVTGRSKLSSETGLSERQIRTALDKLISSKEVTSQTTNKNSTITVLNYDLYQNTCDDRPAERPARSPSIDQPHDHKQEVKKENKKENKKEYDLVMYPSFEDFWDLYSKKSGNKEKSRKLWGNQSQHVKEKIMTHVDYYVLSTPDKQFRKNPETYLQQAHWKNEILNTQKITKDGKQQELNKISTECRNQYPNL